MLIGHREIEEVNAEQMATFAAFAHHLSRLGLGIHCAKCSEDLRGRNSEIDQTFSVSCRCREFKAENPQPRVIQ